MSFTSDFIPFATGTNALVLTPSQLLTETWLLNGFQVGIADPASCNTLWRQSSFVVAGITQWMANVLSQNIHDDGNLSNFVSLFGASIAGGTAGGVTSFNGRRGAVVLTSSDVTTALGYSPVQTFNGRTGVVVLNASDVDTALGYVPVNKAGDTMINALSGPSPTVSSHYATKGYVDNSASNVSILSSANGVQISGTTIQLTPIPNDTVLGNVSGITNFPVAINPSQLASLIGIGLGGISGSGTEYDFPLPGGGIMKMGLITPGATTSYTYTYITPFAHAVATVICTPAANEPFTFVSGAYFVVTGLNLGFFTYSLINGGGASMLPFTYLAIGF